MPAPRLDPLDKRIVETVRDVVRAKVWSVLNWLADDEGAQSRAEGRDARLKLWGRIKRLKRLKVIYGVGRNEIAATKPVANPSPPRTRRRKRSAGRLPRVRGVSAANPAAQGQRPEIKYPVGFQLLANREPITTATTDSIKTETVITPEQASEAGRALAKMPRKQVRKLTGFLHGQRCWRGRKVVLPNGEVTGVCWTSRGRVLLEDANDLPYRSWLLRVARREQDVLVYRNPVAVLLGRRKAGVKERESARKQAAARLNGCRPVRPGRRPRGRPRTQGNGVTPD